MFRHTQLRRESKRVSTLTELNFVSALDDRPTAISIADANLPDTPLVFVNKAFSKLTGYDKDTCLGQNCRFLQGPDTNSSAVTEIRNAVSTATSLEVCLLNYHASGKAFHNFLLLTPFTASDGRTYFVGCQFELTPRLFQIDEHLKRVNGIINAISLPHDHPWTITAESLRMRASSVKLLIDNYVRIEELDAVRTSIDT